MPHNLYTWFVLTHGMRKKRNTFYQGFPETLKHIQLCGTVIIAHFPDFGKPFAEKSFPPAPAVAVTAEKTKNPRPNTLDRIGKT